MTLGTDQFERVAETVMERTSDLLSTQVSVVDGHGRIVASNDAGLRGLTLYSDDELYTRAFLRVPLHIDSDAGEVLISEPASGEAISPRLARVLAELIIDQTAVVDRLPNKHELKNKFIHDLLHGALRDEASILREAQILGMDFSPPRLVILIDAASYILAPPSRGQSEPTEGRVRRRSQLVIGSIVDFFELPDDTICGYVGDGEVAVLKASNRKNLGMWVEQAQHQDGSNPSWANLDAVKRAGLALLSRLRSDTRADISVGIGRYHAGLKGIARSYEDARAALSLGQRFHGQNQVHCLDDLGIAAFVGVSDEGTKVDLARFVLSPLDQDPDLLATLSAFFDEDCCPSTAAARLSIHRNTLAYRLDKITSLTGLDPRHFDDAVQIRLAMTLRSLQRDPRPSAIA